MDRATVDVITALSVLLLPSPLLPGTAYEGLRVAVAQRGVQVAVAPAELALGETAGDLVRRWAGLMAPDTVLVPHSNAGFLAPAARARAKGRRPIVFMDAALPPESGATRLAPPQFRAFLADLVDDAGTLPPWTRWWPRADLAAVVPPAGLDALDRACPRVPLSYFDERLSAPDGWAADRNAYLAFGATYAHELATAADRGWPHTLIEGGHLHFLHDPEAVAVEILSLARRSDPSVRRAARPGAPDASGSREGRTVLP